MKASSKSGFSKVVMGFILLVLLGGLAFAPSTQSAYAMSSYASYTVTASKVSFVSGIPNSHANWVQATVICPGSSNFKLSTQLFVFAFNPASWATEWCINNVVQIGIPSALYLLVWPFTGPYQNPANWKVTYTR